jgi:hypothetical protein
MRKLFLGLMLATTVITTAKAKDDGFKDHRFPANGSYVWVAEIVCIDEVFIGINKALDVAVKKAVSEAKKKGRMVAEQCVATTKNVLEDPEGD